MTSIQEIEFNVNSWVEEYLGDFTFRQYQFEYIVKTLNSILNDKMPLNIIEAPTGSGKSIIVMIMAGVLDKYYEKKSYILCSDLYLWQQYADAIRKKKLYFGKIKGTSNNYVCGETGEDFSLAPCRMQGIAYAKLFNEEWGENNGWECAARCNYIRERKKALRSNVTLMTYQLYFPYMCDDNIKELDKHFIFTPRDVVFCDECHNVPDLCQQYCAIGFDDHRDFDKYKNFLDFCKIEDIVLEDGTSVRKIDTDEYINDLRAIYEQLKNTSYTEQDMLYEILRNYRSTAMMMIECLKAVEQRYMEKNAKSKKKKKALSRREYIAIDNGKWIDKQVCSVKMYLNFAKGQEKYIVKTDNKTNGLWSNNPVVYFKFAKEDALVYQCILKNQPSTVMLSATVGDHRSFDDNIGTKYLKLNESRMFNIPSTFDFSKSPIYYIPGNKMSKDCINYSLPINAGIINQILMSPKHINEKGIIHTGSYKNAQDLFNMLSEDVKKRVYLYNTAKEKQGVLDRFKKSYNGVLIGPTLTEGIDLPNDGCRFIIILKIPYPFLGDNLVKAKCALFPRWYNSETTNNVIQGIGRGNRTPDDWSTTYILDGCFTNLYQETREQYSDLKDRMHMITNNKQ